MLWTEWSINNTYIWPVLENFKIIGKKISPYVALKRHTRGWRVKFPSRGYLETLGSSAFISNIIDLPNLCVRDTGCLHLTSTEGRKDMRFQRLIQICFWDNQIGVKIKNYLAHLRVRINTNNQSWDDLHTFIPWSGPPKFEYNSNLKNHPVHAKIEQNAHDMP